MYIWQCSLDDRTAHILNVSGDCKTDGQIIKYYFWYIQR